MKKALIHDWYYINGGAEKVIHSINRIWDDFDHYALIDFLPKEDREYIFSDKSDKVKTSFIQKLPTAKTNHRKFLKWFPLAIEQFDLSEYELIISSSSSIAKGVMTHANQLHISYIHSPMRYAWDLYYQYLNESGLTTGLKGWYAKRVLHHIRTWDIISTNRVDHLVANSGYIAKRIQKIYRRNAHVIYPPVDTNYFTLETNKEEFYLTASRMVSYKKIDIIIDAFSKMPNRKLVVIGDGPEMNKIKSKATKNIELLGHVSHDILLKTMQKAKAFIFAAEEDFGILPVEAQACGTPVIAFGKGGVLETVVEKKSGVFFYKQKPSSIIDIIPKFEKIDFDPELIRKNSQKFSKERFEKEFKEFVDKKVHDFLHD